MIRSTAAHWPGLSSPYSPARKAIFGRKPSRPVSNCRSQPAAGWCWVLLSQVISPSWALGAALHLPSYTRPGLSASGRRKPAGPPGPEARRPCGRGWLGERGVEHLRAAAPAVAQRVGAVLMPAGGGEHARGCGPGLTTTPWVLGGQGEQGVLPYGDRWRLRHVQCPRPFAGVVAPPRGQPAVVGGCVHGDAVAAVDGGDEGGGAGAAERVEDDSGAGGGIWAGAGACVTGDAITAMCHLERPEATGGVPRSGTRCGRAAPVSWRLKLVVMAAGHAVHDRAPSFAAGC